MSACFVACFACFAPGILHLFVREAQTSTLGASFLRIACLAVPLTSVNFLISYTLQAMGKGAQSAILTSCRQGLVNIPLLLLTAPDERHCGAVRYDLDAVRHRGHHAAGFAVDVPRDVPQAAQSAGGAAIERPGSAPLRKTEYHPCPRNMGRDKARHAKALPKGLLHAFLCGWMGVQNNLRTRQKFLRRCKIFCQNPGLCRHTNGEGCPGNAMGQGRRESGILKQSGAFIRLPCKKTGALPQGATASIPLPSDGRKQRIDSKNRQNTWAKY